MYGAKLPVLHQNLSVFIHSKHSFNTVLDGHPHVGHMYDKHRTDLSGYAYIFYESQTTALLIHRLEASWQRAPYSFMYCFDFEERTGLGGIRRPSLSFYDGVQG